MLRKFLAAIFLLASPALSATSGADSRFIPQPISEQTVFETAF